MYTYQKQNLYYAQVLPGIEEELSRELSWLGAEVIKSEFGLLTFTTDKAGLYRINLRSRLATRILAPLISFRCPDADKLYRATRTMEWRDFLRPNGSFAIVAHASDNEAITNSHFAALKLKDAICDHFRARVGRRPDVDKRDPDVIFHLHIKKERASISVDTSGGSLHRRGYRTQGVEAPMQETLAAAILAISEWDLETPLVDPMCGSGTLLSEALMLSCDIPSGYLRKNFGLMRLPNFNKKLWEAEREKAVKRIQPPEEGLIMGSDISKETVSAARENMANLPGGREIPIFQKDVRKLKIEEESVIICNPPYGIRLGDEEKMKVFYKEFGDFLKNECKGCTAYVYFGNRDLIGSIGLKASWKRPLMNGGLDGRLCKYEMY
ncbi:MAG: THUMP domain-containing protein [Desulfobacterales bacterium]|nr:THUMP domain-containing protein [Desulfobacterales bacterium]